MVVTAMLNWYDEPVELLREAIAGAAIICDRIVAADGAYALVQDKRPLSPPSQRKAIEAEAASRRQLVQFVTGRIYEGQVHKRNITLQWAKNNSDWVMVLDADWRIHGEREPIRAELERYLAEGIQQVLVNFATPDDPSRGWEEKAANVWHVQQANQWFQLPFIYRVFPLMRYEKNHWSLYAEDEHGARFGLFGLRGLHGTEMSKQTTLKAEHMVEHRCLFRKPKQIQRNRSYIGRRDYEVEQLGYET